MRWLLNSPFFGMQELTVKITKFQVLMLLFENRKYTLNDACFKIVHRIAAYKIKLFIPY